MAKLQFLHSKAALSSLKLDELRRVATAALKESLQPGRQSSLKARVDGTVLDGHHRLTVLRERGVDIDALPRDIIEKNDS